MVKHIFRYQYTECNYTNSSTYRVVGRQPQTGDRGQVCGVLLEGGRVVAFPERIRVRTYHTGARPDEEVRVRVADRDLERE